MDFDPVLFFLMRGYTQRVPPEYFADTDDFGIVWQADVYPEWTPIWSRRRRCRWPRGGRAVSGGVF
jgi:hypothetical protein